MNLIRFVSSIMTTYCHDTSWRAPRTASNFLFFCLFLSCNSRLKNSDRKPFVVCVELIGTWRSCDLTLECFGLSGTLLWCIMDLRWKSSRACIYQSIQKFNLWIPLHVLLRYAHLHTSGGCLPLAVPLSARKIVYFHFWLLFVCVVVLLSSQAMAFLQVVWACLWRHVWQQVSVIHGSFGTCRCPIPWSPLPGPA